jgi:hypothetical protein
VSRISPLARILLSTAAVAGLLAYLTIVDLGVNAGVIHRGVRVGHIDVGGLSEPEAAAEIKRVGAEMRDAIIPVEVEGVTTIPVYPRDLGWKPRAEAKAVAAMGIGREGGIISAASARISAWFGGHRIPWDEPRPRPLRRQIRQIVRAARLGGVELAWSSVRRTLIEATYDWPRRDSYSVEEVAGG